MKTMMVPATPEQLEGVLDFVNREVEEYNGSAKTQMQISLAVEEVFTNIANYAYHPETGEAAVRCGVEGDPLQITIQFIDGGKPYNPLEKEDPDITLSAEERNIGGLGVYLVKQIMDAVSYEYKDGKNILTMRKVIP